MRRSVLALSSVLFCLALTEGPLEAKSELERIKKIGKLVMLAFPQYPDEWVEPILDKGTMPKSGGIDDFRGLDVDLLSAFAARLGVQLEIRVIEEPNYEALIPALLAGKGDIVGGGFSDTATRRRQADFSHSYFSVWAVVMARNNSSLRSLEDLKRSVGAVLDGSSQVEILKDLGLPAAALRRFEFSVDTRGALIDGEVDFALTDSVSVPTWIGKHGLKPILALAEDRLAFALPPGSDLGPELDAFLREAEANGEIERLTHKYFGDVSGVKGLLEGLNPTAPQ